MTETTAITVSCYRDDKGNPTCMADARTGSFCPFLMTSHCGTREHCYWLEGSGKHRPQLQRDNNGSGYIIPHENCPVWTNQIKSISGKD